MTMTIMLGITVALLSTTAASAQSSTFGGDSSTGVVVRETSTVVQDKYPDGANDLHIKLWQKEDNVEVNGWTVTVINPTSQPGLSKPAISSQRGDQPAPAHSEVNNLGGIPPTDEPDNGQHAVDVTIDWDTETVDENAEVTVESEFVLTDWNTKRIVSNWTRTAAADEQAVPDHGWSVDWHRHAEGGYLHTITIYNDDVSALSVTNFEYLVDADFIADLSTINFGSGTFVGNLTIGAGGSQEIQVVTPLTSVGAHLYFKFQIEVGESVVFTDIVDHPIVPRPASSSVVPAASTWGVVAMVVLVLAAATVVIVRRRRMIAA
jgi:hypothetical protein